MTWQIYAWDHSLKPWSLFSNGTHNLGLAHFNILEHFVHDLQKTESNVENLTSYRLLSSFLSHELTTRWPDTLQIQFQIRIFQKSEKIEIFVSPWIHQVKL